MSEAGKDQENEGWKTVEKSEKKEKEKEIDIIETPATNKKIVSKKVCSGQPTLTNMQLKKAFPEINQNLFKIKFEMNAGLGKSFNEETYIWAIKTFFQLCIRKDNTFKVLPINPEESGANTISHIDQIPIEQRLFEKGYAKQNISENDNCDTI